MFYYKDKKLEELPLSLEFYYLVTEFWNAWFVIASQLASLLTLEEAAYTNNYQFLFKRFLELWKES